MMNLCKHIKKINSLPDNFKMNIKKLSVFSNLTIKRNNDLLNKCSKTLFEFNKSMVQNPVFTQKPSMRESSYEINKTKNFRDFTMNDKFPSSIFHTTIESHPTKKSYTHTRLKTDNAKILKSAKCSNNLYKKSHTITNSNSQNITKHRVSIDSKRIKEITKRIQQQIMIYNKRKISKNDIWKTLDNFKHRIKDKINIVEKREKKILKENKKSKEQVTKLKMIWNKNNISYE